MSRPLTWRDKGDMTRHRKRDIGKTYFQTLKSMFQWVVIQRVTSQPILRSVDSINDVQIVFPACRVLVASMSRLVASGFDWIFSKIRTKKIIRITSLPHSSFFWRYPELNDQSRRPSGLHFWPTEHSNVAFSQSCRFGKSSSLKNHQIGEWVEIRDHKFSHLCVSFGLCIIKNSIRYSKTVKYGPKIRVNLLWNHWFTSSILTNASLLIVNGSVARIDPIIDIGNRMIPVFAS